MKNLFQDDRLNSIFLQLSLDKDLKIVDLNQRVLSLMCFGRDDIIGKDFSKLLTVYNQQSFLDNMTHTIRLGLIWEGDLSFKNSFNHPLWLHCNLIPINDSSGNLIEVQMLATNITSRKLELLD